MIPQILPAHTARRTQNRFLQYLRNGLIIEAIGLQASSAMEIGLAKYWYPQYVGTVVIAVDRDQTNAQVNGWSDLVKIREQVGFIDAPYLNIEKLLAAISYGLEGENFSFKKAAALLDLLND